jgi:hypothetical protein
LALALGIISVLLVFAFGAAAQTSSGDEFIGPFSSWNNIKNSGAAGNGSQDDTAAIQAALNRLGTVPGGPAVLYFPAGTYRITSTLQLTNKLYVALIGDSPDTTVIQWAGPAGGTMLNIDGMITSRVDRLTFDGGGSAGLGIDQSWSGQNSYFDTHNEYADDQFRDMGEGIRGGYLGYGAADSVVLRCRFLRISKAGVAVASWNALNWFVRECYFQGNTVGVSNVLPNSTGVTGAGNFHVYNSVFLQSSRADIEITNPEYFGIHNNLSIGSQQFFLADPSGSAPNPITFQGNTILNPVGQPITIGSAGPVMLFDNVIKSDPGKLVASMLEGYSSNPVNSNLISIGNTLTRSNPYSVGGRTFAIDDVVSSSIPTTTGTWVAPAPNLGRPVYEVPAGSSAAAIQKIVNTAIANSTGQHPVVHFPPANYPVDTTIVIPAGADVQLVGDGGASDLTWTGAGAGPMLQISTPTGVRLRDLRLTGGNRAAGLLVNVQDVAGASVFMDQTFLNTTSQNNLLVQALDHARVKLYSFYNDSSKDSIKVTGGSLLSSGQASEADVEIFGAGDGGNQITYDISNGAKVFVSDAWYEGGAPGFVNLTSSGQFSILGSRVYNSDPGHGGAGQEIPPFLINDFNGPVNILNTKIGRGGIQISGTGTNTSILAMGMDGPAKTPNYFLDSSPLAKAGLFYSSVMTPAGGSAVVSDQSFNIPASSDFVRTMMASVRAVKPLPLSQLPTGATDLRLFRVTVEQATVGAQLQGVPTQTPTIAITSPASGQTVAGMVQVATSAPTGWTVQFRIDGGSPIAANSGTSLTLNTTVLTNASHSLVATAADSAGNSITSSPVTITVNNVVSGGGGGGFPASGGSGGTPLVTAFAMSILRNNYSGWVGTQMTVGSTPISVSSAGRLCLSGNRLVHSVKLVRQSDGADVPGATARVSMDSCLPGQFVYGSFASVVTLAANTTYYLVSQEFGGSGNDFWYDYGNITAAGVVSIDAAIYWNGFNWTPIPGKSQSYVPVNLLYSGGSATPAPTPSTPAAATIISPSAGASLSDSTVQVVGGVTPASGATVARAQFRIDGTNLGPVLSPAPFTSIVPVPFSTVLDTTKYSNGTHSLTLVGTDSSGNQVTSAAVSVSINNAPPPVSSTALVSSFAGSILRNNYGFWSGIEFSTPSQTMTVSALGRYDVAGSSASHQVKLVTVADGNDVPGSTVIVNLAAGTPGSFTYVQLPSPITLRPNTQYYLVSSEVVGGDQWYDFCPINMTGGATVLGPVYWDGFHWFPVGIPGMGYGPLSLLYSLN